MKTNKRKKEKQEVQEKKELKGLGGWLILVQIMLILTFPVAIYYIISSFNNDFINNSLRIIKLIIYITQLALLSYTIFLLYRKKKSFVKWAILSLWLCAILEIVFGISSYLLIGDVESEGLIIEGMGFILLISSLIYAFIDIIKATIWTFYLKKSRRVKNTFIN